MRNPAEDIQFKDEMISDKKNLRCPMLEIPDSCAGEHGDVARDNGEGNE